MRYDTIKGAVKVKPRVVLLSLLLTYAFVVVTAVAPCDAMKVVDRNGAADLEVGTTLQNRYSDHGCPKLCCACLYGQGCTWAQCDTRWNRLCSPKEEGELCEPSKAYRLCCTWWSYNNSDCDSRVSYLSRFGYRWTDTGTVKTRNHNVTSPC
jgi:hypothetical protein